MSNEPTLLERIERSMAVFHKEQHGVAPDHTQAHTVEDLVIVRMRGVFTNTEKSLAETVDGRKIIQSARRELRAHNRRQAEAVVSEQVGLEVLRSYCDLDVRLAEQVEVYVLARSL